MGRFVGAGRSDVGLKREKNEDSFFLDDNLGLYLVADGMGGAASGEVASQLVAQTVADYVRRYADAPLETAQRLHYHDAGISDRANTLMQAIFLANKVVFDAARKNPVHKGMGSTLAAVMMDDDHLLAVNVGDSRIFRSRNGDMEQLTVDHRFSDDPKFRGVIDPEATIMTQMGNTLTRAMGVREDVEPDLHQLKYQEGDIYLLCSDGLSDMVPGHMIAKVLSMSGDLEKKAGDLIQLALAGGGKDNVTAVLAEVSPQGGLMKLLHKITGNS